MRRSIVLYILGMLVLASSAESDAPPFNKAELEAMLKAEHSQKIANIYDSATSTQCAANRKCPPISLGDEIPATAPLFRSTALPHDPPVHLAPQVHLEH